MRDEPGYEEVRRRLLERGYLGGRIQRFVLRDAVPGRASVLASIRTAAKAAILGAPALGALLASAVTYANRPLLGVRDAVVLWAYLAVVSAVVLFVLDLSAASIVGLVARRRGVTRGDALRAAFIAGLPVLAYLVFLWWRRDPGGSPWIDASFLAGAVAVTLLVAWLARLVSLADLVRRTGEVPETARRGILSLVAVTVPVAIVVLVLGRGGEHAAGRSPSPFEPTDGTPRVLVVAIDGLDGDLLEALDGFGAVEDLVHVMEQGAVFPVHRSVEASPPEVWTSVATGVPADVHGIRGVGSQRIPGISAPVDVASAPLPLEAAIRFLVPSRTVPTSGSRRVVRAAWEIVSLRRPAAAVGWWATWPAEIGPAGGYVVSDRVLPKMLSGGDEFHDTAPRSLHGRLAADFPAVRSALRAEFDARFSGLADDAIAGVVWESFLIDGFHLAALELVRGDPELHAAVVYLPGLDILRARLGRGSLDGDAERLLASDAVARYVAWLGHEVRRRVEGAPHGRAIIIADPGRAARLGAEGVAVALGPGVVGACIGSPISPLDVAPMMLSAAGFPASQEMPGSRPATCLPGWSAPDRIRTYGRRPEIDRGIAGRHDPELLERLRSLGYL